MESDELRRARWVLALVCTVQFVVVLDLSVVNVALPTIGADLQFPGEQVSWVANGYALVNTAKQIGGALGLALILVLVVPSGAAVTDYRSAFLAIAGILAAIAVLALLLPSTRDQRPAAGGGETPAAANEPAP